MSQPWDAAVKRGLEDDTPASAAIELELVYLWSDLADARGCAINGIWSMQCDWLTERIVWLTRMTGKATPWEQVGCTLLLDGTYAGILSSAGIEYAEPDVNEVRRVVVASGGTL